MQLAFVEVNRIHDEASCNLRLRITPSVNEEIVSTMLILQDDNLMVKPSLDMFASPSALSFLYIDPWNFINDFLRVVNSSIHNVEFTVHAGGMALSVFYHWSRKLQDFPIAFMDVEGPNIRVKASVLEFLFVLRNSPEK